MRHRLAALVAALGLLALGGRGGAQTGEVIHACASAAGKIRVVNADGTCKRRERALAWAIAGAPGPKGDPGLPGTLIPACGVVGRLTIAGITGEEADGSIRVTAYTGGMRYDRGQTGGSGTVTYDPLCVTKRLDKASPQLAQSLIAGTPHQTATLEVFAADGVAVAATYQLTDVLLSSLSYGLPRACTTADLLETPCLAFATFSATSPP